MKRDNIWSRLERWSPRYRRDIEVNGKIIRDVLIKQIKSRLAMGADAASQNSVVDLALKELRNESHNTTTLQPSSEFIEVVISHLKLFVFAGHDTTAQAMYVTSDSTISRLTAFPAMPFAYPRPRSLMLYIVAGFYMKSIRTLVC